ncbi:MAG: ECF transporter S component, partial [Clostridiales bacterium]|nr:ECF transporter S component [Clostridiales bacterium]
LSIIPNLKEKQIEMISASFSWPQLVTALIGVVVAFLILPAVQKALSK